MWGANTFPVRKYNSRTFHLKVRRSRLFRFFRRFPQINVGGGSARIPFVEHASRESRVALPPKGRLRHIVQFRASRYMMRLNLTSAWKVMTILNFSWASVVQFRASQYILRLNRTSEWKVMTIWISREFPLFNFERLDILCAWIGPLSEKLWQFEFLESFHCSISGVSIYYEPESDLRVKSYDHLNFSRASVVQFRASRYIMRLNRTSKWIVMTIWIAQELPLFNFERLEILCAWTGPPS